MDCSLKTLTMPKHVKKMWTKSGALGLVSDPSSWPCNTRECVSKSGESSKISPKPLWTTCKDLKRSLPAGWIHIWFSGDRRYIPPKMADRQLVLLDRHNYDTYKTLLFITSLLSVPLLFSHNFLNGICLWNQRRILPVFFDFFFFAFFFLPLSFCTDGAFTAAVTLSMKISKSPRMWFKMSCKRNDKTMIFVKIDYWYNPLPTTYVNSYGSTDCVPLCVCLLRRNLWATLWFTKIGRSKHLFLCGVVPWGRHSLYLEIIKKNLSVNIDMTQWTVNVDAAVKSSGQSWLMKPACLHIHELYLKKSQLFELKWVCPWFSMKYLVLCYPTVWAGGPVVAGHFLAAWGEAWSAGNFLERVARWYFQDCSWKHWQTAVNDCNICDFIFV